MHWSALSCACKRAGDIASCNLGFEAETVFLSPLLIRVGPAFHRVN